VDAGTPGGRVRGTLVNAATVLLGSGIGLSIGRHVPDRVQRIITTGLGLCTLLIGLQMSLKAQNVLVVIGSVVVGGVLGELLDLEARLERVGARLRRAVGSDSGTFVAGFVTASLVFCVGPMTIVGAIQEGLGGGAELLYTKALLDGAASIAFASALGVGVAFAALTVLVVQMPLTLLGGQLSGLLRPEIVSEMTATGGLLILAIGFLLLDIKRLPVANLLPSLAVVILLTAGRLALGW
jgi:uncharacterized protein